ncbi:MAG TPA: cytidine deaminase [Candidatus Avichristensenella intestinipullorum]|uniref:Endoribonuclease YbeY n=1 Tax=Candidatus Avichristensenella intestinipullorum TaxID=2840693 RepID=A0A9D0YXF0_9FIRM|nr:cytidine deaminase [Candidatus Avichristensenella intestinipullorum]
MHLELSIEAQGAPEKLEALLSRVGDACVAREGLQGKYQAGFVLTDDEGIRTVNRQMRATDMPTDVLSFPSAAYPNGTARSYPERLRREFDAQSGCMHLGDIVVSLPRARAQAEQYGHSLWRELGFLFAHGMLHLLGYDHGTQQERARMRAMEDEIMENTGLSRELTDADFALLERAKEAMRRAYVPYSQYPVGACLRAEDGREFQGCNVENASFGMTICAERNAVTTAVTEGARRFEAIAIAAAGSMPYPCGACRQFLREFAKDMRVLLTDGRQVRATTLQALLPDSFGPESLEEARA